MQQKYKVVMVPSLKRGKNCRLFLTELSKEIHLVTAYGNQELYVISDEEIKRGEWMYDDSPEKGLNHIRKCPGPSSYFGSGYYKIVATTDADLYTIKKGEKVPIPKIPDSFVKHYCDEQGINEISLECNIQAFDCNGLKIERAIFKDDYTTTILNINANNEVVLSNVVDLDKILNSSNQNHLLWIYDRMINEHKEEENFDYMIKFKSIIDSLT